MAHGRPELRRVDRRASVLRGFRISGCLVREAGGHWERPSAGKDGGVRKWVESQCRRPDLLRADGMRGDAR